MGWFDDFKNALDESHRRLNALPKGSFVFEGGGPRYGRKTALYSFTNKMAADQDIINDFDLMVMYDGNPCFGGSVVRHPPSDAHPNGAATITVYTD